MVFCSAFMSAVFYWDVPLLLLHSIISHWSCRSAESRSPDVFCLRLYSKALAVELSQTLPVAMQCLCPSYSTVKSLRSPVRLTMLPLKNWQTASYSVRRLWAKAGELTVIHWHGSLDVGEWSLLSRRDCWHGGNDTASVSSWLPDWKVSSVCFIMKPHAVLLCWSDYQVP